MRVGGREISFCRTLNEQNLNNGIMGQKNYISMYVSTKNRKKENNAYILVHTLCKTTSNKQIILFSLLLTLIQNLKLHIFCSCLNSKSLNYLQLRERSSQIDMTYQIIRAPLFRPRHHTDCQRKYFTFIQLRVQCFLQCSTASIHSYLSKFHNTKVV